MAELPTEQDESLIDMATRYGQGVMRKHPIITRGLASAATDPLDMMQYLAMHGVEPGIVAPNQIETPEQVAARQERASSIPNAGELAQKYLAQAGVRESETLPEQLGEVGISMLGPAMLAKAPKAFSWGAKILGKTSPAKAPALTTDAFHGTSYDFPAFVNNPGKVARGEKDGPFVLDQALGTHFAKDPNVSNTFVVDRVGEGLEGGRIIPARIPDEKTFLEAKQDLLPYITDRSTPRGPSTVHSDQDTIAKMIAAEGYKLRPDLLARYLVQARGLNEDVAASISKRLAKGKSVAKKEFATEIGTGSYKTTIGGLDTGADKKVNLEQFLYNHGGNPYNSKDRADLVDTARKSWQDKGYTGLKYLNTSQRETELAKDPTSYIVFDPKHTRSRFAQFNPADVESSDLLKSHGGAVHMGKGGLLKAGAEELTELAAKYLPKAEKVIPHGDPQREANLARHMEGSKAPPVLYHGTPKWEGTAYNPNQTTINNYSNVAGFYADTNPETASGYAMDVNKIADMAAKFKRGEKLDPSEMGYGPSSQVLPVHMAIKKPFVPGNSLITKPMLDTYAAELKATNSHLSDYSFENWAASKIKDFAERKRVSVNALNGDGMAYQRILKAGGYDGVIDGTQHVAFEPTQIKSAIGNRGTFDPTKTDITKASGGAVRMGKGGLLKAGAEELVELAAKYLPKAEKVIPHGDPQREANLARHMEGSKAPPVLYHGTFVHEAPMGKNSRPLGDIDIFDRHAAFKAFDRPENADAIGTWLSETSGGWSSKRPGAGLYVGDPTEGGATIYPVHANIKNPWKPKDFYHFLDEMHRLAGRDPKTQNPLGRGSVTELRDDLIASGYDGIYFKQGLDHADQSPTWVAFHPNQSKSAVGNRGTFDPNEPEITKAGGGPVHMGKGGLLKAGAEELVELAAKYLPKAEKVAAQGDLQQANLYHVTFSDNVSKIKEKGINPIGGGSSNWVKGKTQKRYQETPAVYAFDNPKDALVWAAKMEYGFKKPISILKTKFNDSWVKDPSEDFSLTQYGKALKTNSVVKPDNISGVTDFSAIPKARGTDMNFDEWISHHGKEIEKTTSDIGKASGGPVRMGKGGLLKAGAEELVELAAKYLPKAEKVIPHGDPQREANLARHMEGSKAPPVLYHGTASDVKAFDPKLSGSKSRTGAPEGTHFFTDKKDVANSYTVEWQGDFGADYLEGANVMPVHLAIKNPLVLSAKGEPWSDIKYNGRYRDINEIARLAKQSRHGYDGLIVKRVLDSGRGQTSGKPSTTYVAFEPTQIKSATGNRGTFDPTEPDITKSSGGPIRKASGGLSRRHAC